MNNMTNIDALIKDLDSEAVSERRNAARELAGADTRAVYPLLKALRDDNPGVQDAAMRSLIAIGGEVVAYMVLPLLREDSFLRNTAMLMLREIGAYSVPLLYPLLADKDDDVRKFSLDLLGDICEDVDAARVLPLLKDSNANVRASAVRTVGVLMPEGTLERLIESLQDEEWVSFAALETLANIKDERAIDAICKLLQDESITLRMAAVDSLGSIGSTKASDALFEHVKKTDGMEQNEAIKSLVQTGMTPSMSAVYDLLLQLIQDGDWEEQKIAIKGLVELKDVNAIPIIIDVAGALDDSIPGDDEKIMAIKEMLKGFGPTDVYASVLDDSETRYKGKVIAAELAGETRSEKSAAALIKHLSDGERDVKRACAHALGKIGTPEAIAALLPAVDDHEGHVRKTAIEGLGHAGSEVAFEKLVYQLEEEEYDDIMEAIVKSLIGIDAKRLYADADKFSGRIKEAMARTSNDLDTLLRLAGDEDLSVVLASIAGLGNINDQRSVDRVIEATESFDPEVRRTAAMALTGMSVGFDVVLPLLADKDMWVRLHAVRMLGQGGASDMLSHLGRMLEDCDVPVVLAAIESIIAIGGREAFDLLNTVEAKHSDPRVKEAAALAIESM